MTKSDASTDWQHDGVGVVREGEGEPRLPFVYKDRGSMATIGRNKAVAQVGGLRFSGVIAWWLWLFVHVLGLVELRRRVAVLLQWAWAYVSWQRSSRVILEVPVIPADPAASSHAKQRVLSTGT